MSAEMRDTQHKTRGRPRAFDREAALRSAMEVFWDKGFDTCSMADLVDAMGINSPSLYAAFGSKEDLYREAVELYTDTEGGAALRQLQAHEAVRDGLRAMFRTSVELFTGTRNPRGCMIFLGAMSVGPEHAQLRGEMQKRRRKVASIVAARLAEGVANGELDARTDTPALAALCMTLFAGLSILAQDGVRKAALFAAIDQFIATLPLRAKR
ncbi:TetR family transcriptional regulator [Caballeronia novacaledonica]|uniref:TetR family transcriptional regulator n=1 Tax=Caballeronia novacaledonica TaxID=1544861 RepID=A0A2U3I5E9_9BURK|nr:TetR/AcrR family transcriptional regulator [Caballeronia novacaledonica]SPB15331.1 TetR family transcriptional regulator [Caballeronia novacaledonica]